MNRNFVSFYLQLGIGLFLCLCPSLALAQTPPFTPVPSATPFISLSSPDTISADATVPLILHANNTSRDVKEFVVTLRDSASGDTIETWFPILPPQSQDSSSVFWNTKGAKPGRHVLKAILATAGDSAVGREESRFVVTVKK